MSLPAPAAPRGPTMHVEIREEPPGALPAYGSVPIAFDVRSVLDCAPLQGGLAGLVLTERRLEAPYVKDYDAIEGDGPSRWPDRFDTRNWVLLTAWSGGTRLGGATVAFDTPGMDMLEGRRDLAVLWDLRIAPEHRGRGAGARLFRAAAALAAGRGCTRFKVETQNVNVPACRFYAAQGCTLGAVHRFAYPALPEEVQLLWYLDLSRAQGP